MNRDQELLIVLFTKKQRNKIYIASNMINITLIKKGPNYTHSISYTFSKMDKPSLNSMCLFLNFFINSKYSFQRNLYYQEVS